MTSSITKTVFKLGRFPFTVSNCDQSFVDQLSLLLPPGPTNLPDDEIYEAKMGCTKEVPPLTDHFSKRHVKHISISAAAFLTPERRCVLVSGSWDSGKSALALALAYGSGWKVISEFTVLIDPETEEVVNFAAPFCVKARTAGLVNEATGIELPEPVLEKWLPVAGFIPDQNCRARFDLLVHLDATPADEPLQTKSLTLSEFIQKNMSNSNLFRMPGATIKFSDYASDAHCYLFSNGSVKERYEMLLGLARGL